LEQFQRDHGHLNVPRTFTKHANLGSWVAKVRERYRHYGSSSSSSSSERIQQRLQDLQDIGFIWDVLEYKWQQKFQQLIVFYEQHGHVDVPDTMAGLGSWVKDQRREFKKIKQGEPSRLTPQHAKALHRIGLDWYRQQTVQREKQSVFMKRLQEFTDYCNSYSYCVDDDDDYDDSNTNGNDDDTPGVVFLPSIRSMPQQLRNWVERQRKLYRKWLQGNYDMTEERRCLLEDAGVVQGITKELGMATNHNTSLSQSAPREPYQGNL
jgi:Helicase associated domain